MPRLSRDSRADVCYHVIDRGNARQQVFHSAADYEAFLDLVQETCESIPIRIHSHILMPNHFHFILRPYLDGDLSRWVHRLLTTHVRRHHARHETSGHLWQGRFKAFPIEDDAHLLAVLRYVERNALRSGLVRRAEDWLWCSLQTRLSGQIPAFLSDVPVSLPSDWVERVNAPMTAAELNAIRRCVQRGAPYGSAEFVRRMTTQK
jgi:putative transposase